MKIHWKTVGIDSCDFYSINYNVPHYIPCQNCLFLPSLHSVTLTFVGGFPMVFFLLYIYLWSFSFFLYLLYHFKKNKKEISLRIKTFPLGFFFQIQFHLSCIYLYYFKKNKKEISLCIKTFPFGFFFSNKMSFILNILLSFQGKQEGNKFMQIKCPSWSF